MSEAIATFPGYEAFVKELKQRIRTAQVRAALAVNSELVLLYWQMGRDILAQQQQHGWGAKVIDQLSADLHHTFSGMEGFFTSKSEIHACFCGSMAERVNCASGACTIDVVSQYCFVGEIGGSRRASLVCTAGDRTRLEPERAGASHREQIVCTTGKSRLEFDEEDYYLDLLFYHVKLRCYVIIELKTGQFQPEYAGKMNFYLAVADDVLRHPDDAPTIGLILCRTKKQLTVEYALRNTATPIGVSEYQLVASLPDALKGSLPTTEQFEAELQTMDSDEADLTG